MTPPQRPLLPVVIGIALTIVLLAGLGYLAQVRRNAAPATPTIRLVQPGAQPADSPLAIRFISSRPLELTTNGWVSGPWHLHARINGTEFMPAAAEITATDSVYTWTLPAVRRGPIALKLGWADQRHREVSTGSSDVVETTLH